MTHLETIKKRNLSEEVAQQLLTSISDGKLKPGDRLPSEAELGKMFGVSRTAVREGIKALTGISVLSVSPGRGTFVSADPDNMIKHDVLKISLRRETLGSLYEIRYVLDVGIARLAALKAEPEDIDALRKAADKLKKAVESEPIDTRLATEGDEEFHLAFYRAAHNKILENIARPVVTHVMVRVWRNLKGISREFGQAAVVGHKEIIDAIENKDVVLVIDAVERHLRRVFRGIEGFPESAYLLNRGKKWKKLSGQCRRRNGSEKRNQ